MQTNESRIEYIRSVCLSRGANGIKGISRQFKIIDDDGSKSIDFAEFKKVCIIQSLLHDDTHTRACTHTNTRTNTRVRAHTRARLYTHTRVRTKTHAHTHMHTSARSHMHTRIRVL